MRLPFLSHICSGLLPMLYKMDRNPDWKVFLNMLADREPRQAVRCPPCQNPDAALALGYRPDSR